MLTLFAAGFRKSCQDVSVAGKKRGLFDEEIIKELMFIYEKSRDEIIRDHEKEIRTRSGLWTEYKRLIEEIRPRWVVIENVRNLLNSGLASVLKDLNEIGYDAEWEIISAGAVGAPHLRERVWIVAYPRCGFGWASDKRDPTELRRGQTDDEKIGTSNSLASEGSGLGREIISGGMEGIKTSANSVGQGLEGSRIRSCGISTDGNEKIAKPRRSSDSEQIMVPNAYDFRFWPTFATEEQKLQWWTERTARFGYRWSVEPTVCRVDDGIPDGLDKNKRGFDKPRAKRIKQLGNSVVPPIIEIIAERILEIEIEREKINY